MNSDGAVERGCANCMRLDCPCGPKSAAAERERCNMIGETLLNRDPLTDVEEWWDGWESCVYAYQKLIRNTLAGEG